MGGTATVILLSFLLFYLPSVLVIFGRGHEPASFMIINVAMATLYTAVFCLNYFWLVPEMLIRNDRKPLYFIINILIIISLCSIVPALMDAIGWVPGRRHRPHYSEPGIIDILMGYLRFIIRDGVMMVLSAGLAYALRLSKERESVRRRELELNAERRQIELMSLKAQLNPHFLFNSLNNIYALIGFAPDKARRALHDLSSMLRFMIYDSTSPTVPLSKELQFIREYVELMKLRLNSSVCLECDICNPSDGNLRIAPLLFLTLIENAFKHSGPNGKENFISIRITTQDDDIRASISNSCQQDEKRLDPEKDSGVGLDNIKRQLGLIYPGVHSLSITNADGVFTANLAISLKALK